MTQWLLFYFHCSMSSFNCCFLPCIQVSQEAGQVVWCSHLFKNFPQFVVMHTVKGFSMVIEEVDFFFFLECPASLAFCMITICWQFDLWASSNISSNLTQLPSQSLQGLCLNLWPHIDQHPMASEGLNTQQGPALGQSGHQACCPATLSAWRPYPC